MFNSDMRIYLGEINIINILNKLLDIERRNGVFEFGRCENNRTARGEPDNRTELF